MKYILMVMCLAFVSTSCNSGQKPAVAKADTASKKTAAIQYTCTMHPEVLTDKPGTCPKCGMELVEKDKGKK